MYELHIQRYIRDTRCGAAGPDVYNRRGQGDHYETGRKLLICEDFTELSDTY